VGGVTSERALNEQRGNVEHFTPTSSPSPPPAAAALLHARLDGAVGDVGGHDGREQLDAVRVQPGARGRQVQPARRVVHVRARGGVLGVAGGDVVLDLPEPVDGLTERLALAGVCVHGLDAPPRDAQRHARQRQALNLQVAHHA
jgi:hypothetical protein